MKPNVGFSISCYKGDVPLLRGCLESLRVFAPDASICLIADGSFSIKALERVYELQVIRRGDVRDPSLQKWSFGYGLTKMIGFWEAPFEFVFHIDADTVLWGDIRKNLPPQPWDIVFNEPHEVVTPHVQNTQYFNPAKIFEVIPPFAWDGNPYFNTGVVCLRRGSLDLDEYLRMLEVHRKYPDMFPTGEQGMLNILVFRAVRSGRLVAKSAHLQTVVPVCRRRDLEARFGARAGQPTFDGAPTVIHWAGTKPWKENEDIFSWPMDYFRQQALRRCGLPRLVPINAAMAVDEYLTRRWSSKVMTAKRAVKGILCRKK